MRPWESTAWRHFKNVGFNYGWWAVKLLASWLVSIDHRKTFTWIPRSRDISAPNSWQRASTWNFWSGCASWPFEEMADVHELHQFFLCSLDVWDVGFHQTSCLNFLVWNMLNNSSMNLYNPIWPTWQDLPPCGSVQCNASERSAKHWQPSQPITVKWCETLNQFCIAIHSIARSYLLTRMPRSGQRNEYVGGPMVRCSEGNRLSQQEIVSLAVSGSILKEICEERDTLWYPGGYTGTFHLDAETEHLESMEIQHIVIFEVQESFIDTKYARCFRSQCAWVWRETQLPLHMLLECWICW